MKYRFLKIALTISFIALFSDIGLVRNIAQTVNKLSGGSGGTVVYQSAADTTAFLANGSNGQVLTSAGGTSAPTWTTPSSGGTAQLLAYQVADFNNATTTLNNTSLSVTTLAKAYQFQCALNLSNTTPADNVKYDFGGGSYTPSFFIYTINVAVTPITSTTAVQTVGGATSPGLYYTIDGYIEGSAGTLIIRAAEAAHTTGTASVRQGSNCIFTQLN